MKRGENICDGFRGMSARWARSTCCSFMGSFPLPLSISPFSLYSQIRFSSEGCPLTDRSHIWTFAHMTEAMSWCALMVHSLWQSESVFLSLNPRHSKQPSCVPTRQTDGKTLPQRHTPHCLASRLTATGALSMPKPTVWAGESSTTEMKWKSKRGCCGLSMLYIHHSTSNTANGKYNLYERKSVCISDREWSAACYFIWYVSEWTRNRWSQLSWILKL